MNYKRVLLGGLVAGVVLVVGEFVVGIFIGERWLAVMAEMGIAEMGAAEGASIILINFVVGFPLVWFYAAMRPRFGPGPRTAVIVSIAFWLVNYLLPGLTFVLLDFLPADIMIMEWTGGLIMLLVAGIAGAAAYRED